MPSLGGSSFTLKNHFAFEEFVCMKDRFSCGSFSEEGRGTFECIKIVGNYKTNYFIEVSAITINYMYIKSGKEAHSKKQSRASVERLCL